VLLGSSPSPIALKECPLIQVRCRSIVFSNGTSSLIEIEVQFNKFSGFSAGWGVFPFGNGGLRCLEKHGTSAEGLRRTSQFPSGATVASTLTVPTRRKQTGRGNEERE